MKQDEQDNNDKLKKGSICKDYKSLTIEILNMRDDEQFHKVVYFYVKKVNRILD